MTTHEIMVSGKHAATVSVRSDIELCTYVADLRKVWESAYGITPLFVTSKIIRIY